MANLGLPCINAIVELKSYYMAIVQWAITEITPQYSGLFTLSKESQQI